jgi:uncharacterized protein
MSRKHPFKISVVELKRVAGTRAHYEMAGPLDGDMVIEPRGDSHYLDTPVRVTADVESFSDKLDVKATIHASWAGICRRCLVDIGGDLAISVDEIYTDRPLDDLTFPLAGNELDLSPMVRETLMLELPDTPLCRPECAGLCPECGIDLNETDCGHQSKPTDPRWAGLAALSDLAGDPE